MDGGVNDKLKRSLLLNELLFSLNLGFAVAYVLFAYQSGGNIAIHASKPVRGFLQAFSSLLVYLAPLSAHLTRKPLWWGLLVREVVFLVVVAGIALPVLVLLRNLEQTPAGKVILHPVAGITAVAAVPGCWLYLIHATWSIYDPRTDLEKYAYLFVLETIFVGGVLYFVRGRAPVWGILLFILHYVLWFVVIGRQSGPSTFGSLLLSFVFPWSGIAWLAYVRQLARQRVAEA